MNYKKECTNIGMELVTLLRLKAREDKISYITFKEHNEKTLHVEEIINNACFTMLTPNNDRINYLYLSKLSDYVKNMIDRGNHSQLIFVTLEDNARRIKNFVTTTDKKIVNFDDDFDISIREGIKKQIKKLEDKGYTLKELKQIENKQVNDSRGYFKKYERNSLAARGEIIGALNKGFYGMTLEKLEKKLREEAGPCSGSKRFVNYMDKELLMYRIALMEIVRIYENKSKNSGRNKNLDYMKEVMENVGISARVMFAEQYFNVPEEALSKLIWRYNFNKTYSSTNKNKKNDDQIEMNIDNINYKGR